ncbi:MAG: carbamoyltransferase family protein [Steroidobacteraceae bacterium]
MKILGITDHLTSGAALIEDGVVRVAINEERLARKKMVMGFPRQSIEACLRIGGVRPQELDYVAVASKWGHLLRHHVDFDAGALGVKEGWLKALFFEAGSRLSVLREQVPSLESLYYGLRRPVYAQRRRGIRHMLREDFGITAPAEFVWHHYAHAAGAYYASGFADALVVTLDGSGDGHSSHVYEARQGRLRLLHTVPSFDGIGNYYGYITHLCGFKMGKHEGKVTGLAALGKPRYRHALAQFIRYEDGSMRNVGKAFRRGALAKLRAALPATASREDLAASIQLLSEDLAARYVSYWLARTGLRNVALAGGVVANVKINQRIHEIRGVEQVFVYPAMSDEGLAAGAALSVRPKQIVDTWSPGKRCFDHVYLGPEHSTREMEAALRDAGVAFTCPGNLEAQVAQSIAQGYVVARFAGRMEYGPRALGNRSILYRPDDRSVNDWLNRQLARTEFMPFAPSTLAEHADKCFEGVRGARDTARFMTITFDCTREMRERAPGVVHVDGTARPQLVNPSDNPSYYRIIRDFMRRTGLPTIVNTSFNIHEEPIVCSPNDAVRAFLKGNLDLLSLGPFIAKSAHADERLSGSARPEWSQRAELPGASPLSTA